MTRSRIAALAIALTATLAFAASAQAADYIVVLKDGVSEPAVAFDHAKKGAKVSKHYRHALNGYAASLSDSQLAAVRADKRVAFVAPDLAFHATACYGGSVFEIRSQVLPCGVDRIEGDLSSTVSGDGSGSVAVNVAVLDGGIDVEHEDLNVVGGTNCANGQSFDDLNGHGTHVAGSVGAEDNAVGVVGVAPGVRLWAVRVLNKNGAGGTSRILCGIDWVTATRTDNDPDNDIQVANMSLGGKGRDDGNCGATRKDPLHVAICASVQAGVVYAVSAGNEGDDLAGHVPAAYDEVLTATAMTDLDGQPGGLGSIGAPGGCSASLVDAGEDVVDDKAVSFSNFATATSDHAHTLAAPGVCVLSTWRGGEFAECPISCYRYDSGTSMASPHIAGTVALCIASGPCAGLTPGQIVSKIVADAQAYNTANPGYGFQGDPLRPISGKYYGYLIRAGLY